MSEAERPEPEPFEEDFLGLKDFLPDYDKPSGFNRLFEEMGFRVPKQSTVTRQMLRDKDMRDAIGRLFETEDGKKVLSFLVRVTLRRESLSETIMLNHGTDVADRYGWIRKGENRVVHLILGAVAEFREQELKTREPRL